jgi:hypothetical protein
MDDEYILEHLKRWVPLLYGKDKEKFAFVEKRLNYYYFGYHAGDNDTVLNRVSKPVAIFLATNKVIQEQSKIKRTRLR